MQNDASHASLRRWRIFLPFVKALSLATRSNYITSHASLNVSQLPFTTWYLLRGKSMYNKIMKYDLANNAPKKIDRYKELKEDLFSVFLASTAIVLVALFLFLI